MLLQLEEAEEGELNTLEISLLMVTLVVCVAAVSLGVQKQMPQATAGSEGRVLRQQEVQEDRFLMANNQVLLVLSTKEDMEVLGVEGEEEVTMEEEEGE